MAITKLDEFLQNYFISHGCKLLHNNEGVLTVQLTEEMDRALMNRPFYWHYIKKIGQNGEPMQLSLISNPDKREEKGEWIHFGSPRLHQIINQLKQKEKYTKLFQKVNTRQNTPLYPWLVINMKISYMGRQKKDELISIGLHLVNGAMKLEMMNLLEEIPLQMAISDYCYTISPIIKIKSGFIRIENVIDNYIQDQTHPWAEESNRVLEEEIQMLKHFYTGDTEIQMEQMEKEIKDRKSVV